MPAVLAARERDEANLTNIAMKKIQAGKGTKWNTYATINSTYKVVFQPLTLKIE